MGLLNETNAEYYSGQQYVTVGSAPQSIFNSTFDTPLVSAYDINGKEIAPTSNYNVFVIFAGISPIQLPQSSSYVSGPNGSQITIPDLDDPSTINYQLIIQLTEPTIGTNYGSYEYISLNDIVDNFLVGYVGPDNIIPRVRRTDVLFHAKRGLQEFSYDTLKSVKEMELNIPPSLSVPLPQDYVNYVKLAWVDESGVERIIYPTTLTSYPTELPIQDDKGIPTQDSFGENIEASQAIITERWNALKNNWTTNWQNYPYGDYWGYYPSLNWYGRMYGLNPETAQQNGWFGINERTGTISFSSGLTNALITLSYISDGLATDADTKIPKMAEQAMYMHIAYSILSTRRGIPEYIVQRFKKDRSSALRNAKIRLQNIKLGEFTQIMRGKSKWIKH